MLKNILVPLDDSKASLAVLPVIASLVADTGAHITLFTASGTPHGIISGRRRQRKAIPLTGMAGASVSGVLAGQAPRYAETPDQAVQRRESELIEFLSDIARPLRETGHHVDLKVHFGDPIQEICRAATSGEFDLIAMASSNFGRTFRGSVAEGVLLRGVAPVLLVSTSRRTVRNARPAKGAK